MRTRTDDPQKLALLDAILPHVVFDGWSPSNFDAAAKEAGISPDQARAICPRGAVDLAILHHELGDAAMVERFAQEDLTDLAYRDKVARTIRLRLDVIDDKEPVRRASALFALPHMAPLGARLIWGTADQIWEALGDTSRDVNWYTKRATLSGVFASVVLFWLGDETPNAQATTDFIDRRIADVMRFEKAKAQVRDNKALKPLTSAFESLLKGVKAPDRTVRHDLPGQWHGTD